jgi:hypothetical protein
MRLFAALLLFTLIAADVGAQRRCWGQSRGPVGPEVIRTAPSAYEWVQLARIPDQIFLYRNGQQIGNYSRAGFYMPIIDDEWGEICDPPVTPPNWFKLKHAPKQGPIEQDIPNFGVVNSELQSNTNGSRYEISGRQASREEVVQAIEKGLPDDAGKFRLTVIGADAERKRFEDDWKAAGEVALTALKNRCLLWSVPADHWSVKEVGFKTDGHPTVYLQAPDGKVLHRQDDYHGPGDFQAIRKAVDSYDAKKDPDRRKVVDVPGLPSVSPVVWVGVILGVLVLLSLLPRKSEA